MIPDPEKLAQSLGSLAQNYLERSIVTGMPCYGSDWKASFACMACHGSS